jgi:nitronate monooxygenase
MRTPVCELLGMEQPIVQAPIGTAAVPRLAAAVSNAGALGMLALTWAPDVAGLIHQTAALTARPFGGNLVLNWDQHRHLDQALEAGARGLPAPTRRRGRNRRAVVRRPVRGRLAGRTAPGHT